MSASATQGGHKKWLLLINGFDQTQWKNNTSKLKKHIFSCLFLQHITCF